MYPGFVITDGHHIATAADGSTDLMVYNTDGSFYKSVSVTNDKRQFGALELCDGFLYFTLYDPSEPGYFRNETVYDYNLATGEKQVIYVTDGLQQRVTKIVASGDHVALRGGIDDRKLILHTLSTGSNQVIFTSRDRIHGLAIDGDRIMWGCERINREPGREIHVYTISTGEDYTIPESKSIKTWGYGDISGDWVVWDLATNDPDTSQGYPDLINADDTIQLTTLTTGETTAIESLGAHSSLYISGDTVVYLKKPKEDYDNPENGIIRTYNIRTGSFNEFGSEMAFVHDVKGDLLIWGRYNPMSFFATTLNGTLPVVASLAPTQGVTQIPGAIQQPATTPGSPVDPVVIVSALAAGVAGYVALKKKRL